MEVSKWNFGIKPRTHAPFQPPTILLRCLQKVVGYRYFKLLLVSDRKTWKSFREELPAGRRTAERHPAELRPKRRRGCILLIPSVRVVWYLAIQRSSFESRSKLASSFLSLDTTAVSRGKRCRIEDEKQSKLMWPLHPYLRMEAWNTPCTPQTDSSRLPH